MICRIDPADPFVLPAQEQNQAVRLRFASAWNCYGAHPSICSFYRLEEGGVLLVTGKSALVAGSCRDAEQLGAFLRFMGVQQVENAPPLLGFSPAECLLMQKPAGVGPKSVLSQCPVTLTPDLWRLHGCGLFEDADAWYADACLRRRHGAVIGAVQDETGRYLASAGLYAVDEHSAYLTGVVTSPHSRRQGHASAVVAALCAWAQEKQVFLLCLPQLYSLYQPLGFRTVPTLNGYLQQLER